MSSLEHKENILPASILIAGTVLALAIYAKVPTDQKVVISPVKHAEAATLPVWDDLGKQMIKTGVIDESRFRAVYESRGKLTQEMENLLTGVENDKIIMTKENAGFLLNLLWALGLGNKNPILEEGEMVNPRYGGTGNFASTGGWTLAVGDPMDHYSAHEFVVLTPEEQARVDRTSRNIYRPCCANSAHFPDCNHGMAMLALLELLASQGVSEVEMYETAVTVNSYWFPGYTDTVPSTQSIPQTSGCSV